MSLDAKPRVRVAETERGILTYFVALPPEALPPVRLRDVAAAWEAARSAARADNWGSARLFRFRREDGSVTDMALADPDACCWAAAVDLTVGMHTAYGLSLCMRLLALVDLLARARWAAPLFTVRRSGAELDPGLLRAAATAPLNREARFDDTQFRALVQNRALSSPLAPLASGACA